MFLDKNGQMALTQCYSGNKSNKTRQPDLNTTEAPLMIYAQIMTCLPLFIRREKWVHILRMDLKSILFYHFLVALSDISMIIA